MNKQWWGALMLDGSIKTTRFISREQINQTDEDQGIQILVEPFDAPDRSSAQEHVMQTLEVA